MTRNISLDILKVILALLVVGIHTAFLADYSALGNYLTTEGICRLGVPIFVLINGFYFYNITANQKYNVWFKRILSLYLFWLFIYGYYWFESVDGILSFLKYLLLGYAHLWYIPGVIGAAIITIFIKDKSVKFLIFLMLLTFIIGATIQYAGNYHLSSDKDIDKILNTVYSNRNFLFFAFPFFIMGFLMNKYNILKKITLQSLYIPAVIGFVLLLAEAYYNFSNPARSGGFDMYYSLIISAPTLFMLFMKMEFKSEKNIALYSSGIYFVHPFILFQLKEYFTITQTPITLVVIIASYLVTIVLIKLSSRFKFIL